MLGFLPEIVVSHYRVYIKGGIGHYDIESDPTKDSGRVGADHQI